MSQLASVPSNNSPYSDLPPIITKLFRSQGAQRLIGKDEIWVAAAFYGQAKLGPEDIEALARVLDVPLASIQNELGSHWWPNRGLGSVPPTDPVIYRLFEGVLVYGHAIKKPDPKGDRVILTFDGKFLPYAKW
ncbi:hypothetical protein EV363DRAFT_1396630 [Boletus edulis]|nr:hypothetical protein EV363DRAFT_1396630 [Boletus edulis]